MHLATRDGMGNNEATPATPEAILASTRLTRQQKIRRLREMSYDAREQQVAGEEGMAGRSPIELDKILEALRALDAEDRPTDTKH